VGVRHQHQFTACSSTAPHKSLLELDTNRLREATGVHGTWLLTLHWGNESSELPSHLKTAFLSPAALSSRMAKKWRSAQTAGSFLFPVRTGGWPRYSEANSWRGTTADAGRGGGVAHARFVTSKNTYQARHWFSLTLIQQRWSFMPNVPLGGTAGPRVLRYLANKLHPPDRLRKKTPHYAVSIRAAADHHLHLFEIYRPAAQLKRGCS